MTNVGAYMLLEKAEVDTGFNTVTFTCHAGDTFDDGTTVIVLGAPGDKIILQYVTIGATNYWKRTIVSSYPKPGGIASLSSTFTLASSSTLTPVIATTLPAGLLNTGSTYRIQMMGTIQVQATSGTLTFTPYIQGTALTETVQMATQGSAAGPVGFQLEYLITVRTLGASGTALARPYGNINFATQAVLTSTLNTTTVINTTAAAGSNVLEVQAQWATNSATNILTVPTAVIERIL